MLFQTFAGLLAVAAPIFAAPTPVQSGLSALLASEGGSKREAVDP